MKINFNIKFSGKNCRKILEMSKILNFNFEDEETRRKIKEKSLEKKYTKDEFAILFDKISDNVIEYINKIDDNDGSIIFLSKKFDVGIESLLLYYFLNNLTPVTIYYSKNKENLLSLKKILSDFDKKYNFEKNIIFTNYIDNIEENKNNIYVLPLDNNFTYINKYFLSLSHKSVIFFNFLSNQLINLGNLKNSIDYCYDDSFEEYWFPIIKYKYNGLVTYTQGYFENSIPVSIVETTKELKVKSFLFFLASKINYYVFNDNILHNYIIRRRKLSYELFLAYATLVGIIID